MPLSVLQVEDEPDIREITALAFRLDGEMELRSVGSGEEALDILKTDYVPDVILLDVMMPGLNGPATLELLRRIPEHANTPVIFMTARTQRHEQSSYIELGAIGVIPKPFEPTTIGRDIRALLAKSDLEGDELGRLRQQFRERSLQHIPLLKQYLITPRQVALDVEDFVHKLAGTGGTLGFSELSEVASRIDELFGGGTDPSRQQIKALIDAIEKLG